MTGSTTRAVAVVAVVGAVAQLVYGLLAIAFPWPSITGAGGEALWVVANIGMIAGLAGWAMAVAPSRTVAVGATVAGLGFAVRILAAVVTIAEPAAEPLALVLASIVLTLGGVLTVAVGTFRVRSARSATTWLPLVAFGVELVLASIYSVATVLHFVLLGLLWGVVALAVALVVRSHALQPALSTPRPATTV